MHGHTADPAVRAALFSADGYAVEQSRAQHLPYGRYGSHYNGCGWMAAYNILHALGSAGGFQTVAPSTAFPVRGTPKAREAAGSALPSHSAQTNGVLDPALADTVRLDLARGLWFSGKLGTGPFRFARYLRAKGVPVCLTVRRKAAFCRAQHCRAGAVLYWNGHGAHYVAFAAGDAAEDTADVCTGAEMFDARLLAAAPPRALRFFNAQPSAHGPPQTLAAFCAQSCAHAPALFFIVP